MLPVQNVRLIFNGSDMKWLPKFSRAFLVFFLFCVAIGPGNDSCQARENALSWFEQGKSILKTGNYQTAIDIFSKTLDLLDSSKRNSNVVKLARAQAYYQKGDLKNSWKDLNAVLKADDLEGETLASGLHLRGMLNLKKGVQSEAINDFSAAIKTPHGNQSLRSASLTNRAVTLINVGSVDRALTDLNRAIELDGASGFAFAARGMAHLRHDNLELAKMDAESALKLKPDAQTQKIASRILNELNVSKIGQNAVQISMSEEGQVFVQVRFGKQGAPHRFLLDTGATHSLVDKSLIKEISKQVEVKEVGKGFVNIADGSSLPVTKYLIKDAHVYNLPLGTIQVHTFDKKTKKVTNLLGAGSLANLSIVMDSFNRKVELRHRGADSAAQARP